MSRLQRLWLGTGVRVARFHSPANGQRESPGDAGPVDSLAVAPPKRKTGGRVTPAGPRPTDKRTSTSAAKTSSVDPDAEVRAYESGRYTAPIPKYVKESPKWLPILMLGLFVVGGLLIMARYLFWDEQLPMLIGMACLLAGLYTATKWR